MKINDDMPCFGGTPIEVRVSRGRLRCVPPYADQELEFSSVEGRLLGVSKTRWHNYPYWCVSLHDEVNEYRLLFFERSAMFVYLLKCLIGRKVERLSLMVGVLADGTTQMVVEADGKRLSPASIHIPSVKRHRKKEGVNPKDWQDYSERLNALQKIVEGMSQPTRAHDGKGC